MRPFDPNFLTQLVVWGGLLLGLLLGAFGQATRFCVRGCVDTMTGTPRDAASSAVSPSAR